MDADIKYAAVSYSLLPTRPLHSNQDSSVLPTVWNFFPRLLLTSIHHHHLSPSSSSNMPGTVISNATQIWEVGVRWSMYNQCGVWDPKGKGVDIWECIRDRECSKPFLLESESSAHLIPLLIDDSTAATSVLTTSVRAVCAE